MCKSVGGGGGGGSCPGLQHCAQVFAELVSFQYWKKIERTLFLRNVCMSLVLTIEQDSRINFQVTVNKKWLVMIMNRLMQELPSICMMQWSKVPQQWCRRGGAGVIACALSTPLWRFLNATRQLIWYLLQLQQCQVASGEELRTAAEALRLSVQEEGQDSHTSSLLQFWAFCSLVELNFRIMTCATSPDFN